MIDFITSNLWLLWAIVIFICLILELSSGDFFITCFAIGGIPALLTAIAGTPLWLQVTIWAVCSVLSIWFIRPRLLQRLHKSGKERVSNADALIGRVGKVIETIEPEKSGYVKVDGDEWKAIADITEPIKKGENVKIISRDSIIVTVEKV
nr:NfeD family protein [Prevotella sp.]